MKSFQTSRKWNKQNYCIICINFVIIFLLLLQSSQTFGQVNWKKYEYNPVLKVGNPGSWDEAFVGNVSVIYDDNTYKMWYEGVNLNDDHRIGYAVSADGINWTKSERNPILIPGVDGSWDNGGIGGATVLFDGTNYQMWYSGYNKTDETYAIGNATSMDGINWKKHLNPVLISGDSSIWDSNDVKNPSILFDGFTYRMWYQGCIRPDLFKIGYAFSEDGITWEKYGNNPVLKVESNYTDCSWITRPSVLFYGDTYHMWYSRREVNQSHICYASSEDGISWEYYKKNIIVDVGSDGSWESDGVGCPYVLSDGIHYQMWYNGSFNNNGIPCIQVGYISAVPTAVPNACAENIPSNYLLYQNFPNPFNPETAIQFDISQASRVTIKIFNNVGEEIRVLVSAPYKAGSYSVHWNGADKNGKIVPSGLYIYQFFTKDFFQSKKMMLLR